MNDYIKKDADYIKREDALDVVAYYDGWGVPYKVIKNLLSADVAPVRHAHWIKDEYWSEGTGMGEIYGYYYKCSDCGETVQGDYKECTDKYCRNCGAKMDEKLPKGGSF